MSQAHVLQPIPIDGLHPIILSCTITAHIIALLLKINSTTPHTQPPPGRIGGTPPTNRHMIRFTFVATPHSYGGAVFLKYTQGLAWLRLTSQYYREMRGQQPFPSCSSQ